jgi:hypothetical protein
MAEKTAYLVLTIHRTTGQITHVSIWSEEANSCTGEHVHVTAARWRASGETMGDAYDALLSVLRHDCGHWGTPESPLRQALDRLAESGVSQAVVMIGEVDAVPDHSVIELFVAGAPVEPGPVEVREMAAMIARLRAERDELHAQIYPPPTPEVRARVREKLAARLEASK